MAATPSTMRALGVAMPAFELIDTVSGRIFASDSLPDAPATVVAFICNHCPFVIHIRTRLAEVGAAFRERGVNVVAVSSNDAEAYPADGPDQMRREALEFGYVFPYLFDETQDVARAFDAACTPDFFVFDRALTLAYRGQFDPSRPGNGVPVTGDDLRAAVDALERGARPNLEQRPSIGCNIKWRRP